MPAIHRNGINVQLTYLEVWSSQYGTLKVVTLKNSTE